MYLGVNGYLVAMDVQRQGVFVTEHILTVVVKELTLQIVTHGFFTGAGLSI